MKVLLIGVGSRSAETVVLAPRLRWPDAELLVATQAEKGVDLLEEGSQDMNILQPNSSGMSSFEGIQEIRRCSNVPLMVLAGQGDEPEAANAIALGTSDYLRSPYRQIADKWLQMPVAVVSLS